MTSEPRFLHTASRLFDFRLAIGLPVLVMLALLVDWLIAVLCYRGLLYRPGLRGDARMR
jgi:hypothetical protein